MEGTRVRGAQAVSAAKAGCARQARDSVRFATSGDRVTERKALRTCVSGDALRCAVRIRCETRSQKGGERISALPQSTSLSAKEIHGQVPQGSVDANILTDGANPARARCAPGCGSARDATAYDVLLYSVVDVPGIVALVQGASCL